MEQALNEAQAAEGGKAAAHHGVNWIDIVVLLILLGSGIFALMRGFAKEAFVLLSWVAATYLTIKLYPMLQPWMKEQITSQTGANITTGLVIFCGTLVALLPFSNYVIGKVAKVGLTSLDKSLGFVFGVFRGLLVVCLLYLMADQFLWPNEKEVPEAIKTAKSRPIMQAGAKFIEDYLPERKKDKNVASDGEQEGKQDRRSRVEEAQRILQELASPERDVSRNQPSYNERERDHLNELIEKQSQE